MQIREENKMHYKNLSINVSYYRKHKELTQAQLAEMIEVTPKYVSEIESPTKIRQCSLEVIFRIANALDVNPDKLFTSEK